MAWSICPVHVSAFKWPQWLRIPSGWNEDLSFELRQKAENLTEGGVHLVHSRDTYPLRSLRILFRRWVRRPTNTRCTAAILSDEAVLVFSS
jgi:hypothetical protein